MFDFDWVTSATQGDYERVLRHDAVQFLAWRAKHPARKAQSLERSFKTWWLFHARTGFRRAADALRYKRELFQFAAAMKDDLGTPEAPAAPGADA